MKRRNNINTNILVTLSHSHYVGDANFEMQKG